MIFTGGTRTGAPDPIGTALAFSSPTVSTVTAVAGIPCVGPPPSQCYAYSFAVSIANFSIEWNGVALGGQTTAGVILNPSNSSQVKIAGFAVCATLPQASATHDIIFSVGSMEERWTEGTGSATTRISTSQTLVMYVAGSASDKDPLAGYGLAAIGVNQNSGAIYVPIR